MPKDNSEKSSEKSNEKAADSEIGRFLDMVIDNQARLNKALATARKRGTKIAEMVSEQVIQGQREALELTKMVVANPSAYSENAKAMLDAAAESQTRGLDFAKELYNEQVEATENLRESMQGVMERSREATETAMELGRSWGAKNPIADAWQQGIASLRS